MLVASCGHALYPEMGAVGEGYAVPLKVLRQDGRRVISYRLVCSHCKGLYQNAGAALGSPQEAMAWLDGRGEVPRPLESRRA